MSSRIATGGISRPRGGLGLRHIGPDGRTKGPGLAWKLRNFRHWLRDLPQIKAAELLKIPTFYGTLDLQVAHADGSITDYGRVSHRVVTTAYVTALATFMFDGSGPSPSAFDFHDCGTGTTAENASDTTLQTPYGGSRATGTPTNPAAGQYRTTGTVSFAGSFAITEHGVFSASTSGTLLDRSVFSAVNVISGESIQFQYTLTLTAGG